MEIILTGTRAYGPAREDSDWDFVVNFYDGDKIERILTANEFELKYQHDINPRYRGFKFKFGKMQIQIICADSPNQLRQWEKATEDMKNLVPIKDRETRLAQFEKYFKEARHG